MLVEAQHQIGMPEQWLSETQVIAGSNISEITQRREAKKLFPQVNIKLKPNQILDDAIILHADREPSPLEIDSNEDGEISLPTGSTIWMRVNGHQFLISDHTSAHENGTRGVSISHGGKLQHEVRTDTYRLNGESIQVRRFLYNMPTYAWHSMREKSGNENLGLNDFKEVGGVIFSYKSRDQLPNTAAEHLIFENAA